MNDLALSSYNDLYANLNQDQLKNLEEKRPLNILIKYGLNHCSFAIRPSDVLEFEPYLEQNY